jgi:hypothetical protein
LVLRGIHTPVGFRKEFIGGPRTGTESLKAESTCEPFGTCWNTPECRLDWRTCDKGRGVKTELKKQVLGGGD